MTTTAGIRIGPLDIAFLAAVGTYGALSTEDAVVFYPQHKLNSIQKRLRLLAQNGLTRMSRLEVWQNDDDGASNGGRIPTLHLLTDLGADLIEQQSGQRPPRISRSRPAPVTLLHRREIVRVMRAFDQAADATSLDRPDWVMEQDVWHEAPQQRPPNQRRLLFHQFENGLTCAPDLACRFRINQTELALFWEVDLSTEGRKQLRKASKTDGYVALFGQQAYRRYWPDLEACRQHVIWVTPTRRRFAALKDVMKGHPLAPACRLLSAECLADPKQLLTNPVWETLAGDRRAMYRPPAA